MPLIEKNNKITFANQLRGIAVLCVIVAHYVGIYWWGRDIVSQYTYAPVTVGPPPRFAAHIAFRTFNYGPFGVALFFLISGFVIPFSLEKMGTVRFMIARLLRIYPTYWVASALTLFAMWLSSHYWAQPYVLNARQVVANLLLVHTLVSAPTTDLVNWSLAIEVKFYIVSALLWPFLRRSSVLAVVIFTAGVLAALTYLPGSWGIVNIRGVHISLEGLKYELMFVTFLFIGTLFNFALRGTITTGTLIAAVPAMFLLFLMMWEHTVLAPQFAAAVPANYAYALVVFTACYAMRSYFRPLGILDFFADISYPLYLVHALIGYVIIGILMRSGLRYTFAAGVALVAVCILAYLLHILVEAPTANAAKRADGKRRHSEPANELSHRERPTSPPM